MGHCWGRPQESLRTTEKVAFLQEEFAIFGFLSFSNFCTQNQISLKASNSRFGWPKTRVESCPNSGFNKLAILRVLQVLEIHKLKFSVKQTCDLGTLLGGDSRKVCEPLKKWPFQKKNSPFFGLLSFSNFCTRNQICLKASNSSWPALTLGLKVV